MKAAADLALDLVSFMAGGHRFAVEATQVRTQLNDAYPGALTAEALLGMEPDPYGGCGFQRVLMMKQAGADVAVLVTEPVLLHHLPLAAIHPVPALMAASTSLVGMRALGMTAQGLMILVQLRLTLPA